MNGARAHLAVAALAAPTLALVAACSSGSASYSQDQLQSTLATQIATDLGVTAEELSVSCAGGIEGTAGATQTCDVSGPPGDASLVATVTAVDGSEISVSYTFD